MIPAIIKKYRNFLVLILFSMLLMPFTLASQNPNLDQIRLRFSKEIKEEKTCHALHSSMYNGSGNNNAIWTAYYGTVTMIMAKYTMNPIKKYRFFIEGKTLIENSIQKEPGNIEVRFLRFTVQDNTPSFLGYNKEIAEDKKYILDHLESLPLPILKKAIVNYISESDRFTSSEKKWAMNLVQL